MRLRRARFVVGCGLQAFVLAFIAAPCLHTFDHRADHEHGERTVARASALRRPELLAIALHQHAHPHPHPHTEARSPAPGRAALEAPAPASPRPAHGHGALAHFGVAVTPTAIFVAAPPVQPLERLPHLPLATRTLPRPPVGPAQARAPPLS
jgi:hypothetical protein